MDVSQTIAGKDSSQIVVVPPNDRPTSAGLRHRALCNERARRSTGICQYHCGSSQFLFMSMVMIL